MLEAERFMWAVNSGSYSDYRVVCVCDSKERAESVAKALREDEGGYHRDAQAEEMAFVDYEPSKVRVYFRSVEVLDSGTTGKASEDVREQWPFDSSHTLVSVEWRWVRAPYIAHIGGRLDVHGIDEERVAKVFTEKRALLLADAVYRAQREAKGRMRAKESPE